MRSAFDPLPRSLSNRGLGLLVLVVLFGTGVTVHRYLESSVSLEHRPAEVRASGSAAVAVESRAPVSETTQPARASWTFAAEGATPTPSCEARVDRAASPAASPSPASLFRAESGDS